ncbi:hypothetical protein AMJ71_09040 [candidate division TA06 bacterium SM1_40]|uniref:histidine kinase n=1 Tax=candidate division TA06 bacterium SM1_40 TaxID=1703773 RepID=A0A0S8JCJ8_UNCT6|nr:MAG: hypothetical protein AMJ71_09040 [candidate division TA06 bacterium SM1_40]
MRRRRLLWQLYVFYLFTIIVAFLAIVGLTPRFFRALYVDATSRDLEARARLIKEQLVGLSDPARIDALCKKLGRESSTRITVVDFAGNVLGDSDEDPLRMENHGDRPEIARALRGQAGSSMRYSQTRQMQLMYTAVPLEVDGEIVGAVRTSVPPGFVASALRSIYVRITVLMLVVVGLFAAVSLVVSRRVSRLLGELGRGARSFGRAELGRRLPISEIAEIAALAESLNEMAARLDERLRTTTRERNEREAILSSMQEGVLAVDSSGCVVEMNVACGRLLGVDPDSADGRAIEEVLRNVELQAFVGRALTSAEPTEGDIFVAGAPDRFLQAHGAALRDADGRRAGAVIVLNDVTRLRRLERVRRDFVANVSHELKTPITSIRGAAETIGSGALERPRDAERFLEMIARQADRLNAIIEDLLMISRLEQEEERRELELEKGSIEPVVRAAIRTCESEAAAKDISIETTFEGGLTARIDVALLESAVVNLIDNAIKFSEEGGTILVSATKEADEIVIRVRDEGCGIGAQHLPRIFERFYRVDNARSRKLGGTGLGLAIVKHVAQVHGATISVQSSPGKGSTFVIHLPAA